MFDELLHDPDKTEFLVVCIPTGLSAAETGRLVPKLLEMGVRPPPRPPTPRAPP